MKNQLKKKKPLTQRVRELHSFSDQLSLFKDNGRSLEHIMDSLFNMTSASSGKIFIYSRENKELELKLYVHRQLGLKMGEHLPLALPEEESQVDQEGQTPKGTLVWECFHEDKIINTSAEMARGSSYDLSSEKKFDLITDQESLYFLLVPIKDRSGKVMGVIQLTNPEEDLRPGHFEPFDDHDIKLVSVVAYLSGVTIENYYLSTTMKKLFDSFVRTLATIIDEKSFYTGEHCRRVPLVTMMLAEAVNETTSGPLRSFYMNPNEMYELELAALLHDCGKIVTPAHIMDKSTKLECLFDRIELLDIRFEVVKKDMEIEMLKRQLTRLLGTAPTGEKWQQSFEKDRRQLKEQQAEVDKDREFIRKSNIGVESMPTEDQEQVKHIAGKYHWVNTKGSEEELITEEELENLLIKRGTLNLRDREVVNKHVEVTIKMLNSITFPDYLKRVPEIAGAHHEKVDGTGYPYGLEGKDLSVQARIMAVSDIFEALTAIERPYKKGRLLSETLVIMGKMMQDGHIDKDVYEIFIDKKVYLRYAEKNLHDYQVDHISKHQIPGFFEKGSKKKAA